MAEAPNPTQQLDAGEGSVVSQKSSTDSCESSAEVKSEVVSSPSDTASEGSKAPAPDATPEAVQKDETPVEPSSSKESQTNPDAAGDWAKREQELRQKIEDLERSQSENDIESLKLELKRREDENELLKARVKNLETELQAVLSKPAGKNADVIESIKQQHEELLSKARGMIFDKTKMVKNQELQIQALTTQVQSLKDINVITKDLLEIRNSEIKAMEEQLQAMDARWKAEKERHSLVLERAQTSTTINQDLRKEYETQLAIFKELREKYDQRVQALVNENARLKELIQARNTT